MTPAWKIVVWERENKLGKWCPYSSEVCQLLEQSHRRNQNSVCLGDIDQKLQPYTVNLKKFNQISESTGTVSQVRRHICDLSSVASRQVLWQWHISSKDEWQSYESDVMDYIESHFAQGKKVVDLSKQFPEYCYKINFHKMTQQNKKTKRNRTVRRVCSSPFPLIQVDECMASESCGLTDENRPTDRAEVLTPSGGQQKQTKRMALAKQVGNFWNKITKQADSDSDHSQSGSSHGASKRKCENSPKSNLYPSLTDMVGTSQTTETCQPAHLYAIVNGRPWKNPWPPHTSQSEIKPVPGIDPLPKSPRRSSKSQNQSDSGVDIMNVMGEFCEEVSLPPDCTEEQVCTICYDSLMKGSPYDEDKAVIKLKICNHLFHKSCTKAMYENRPKDKFIQCPTCKQIHGVKYGIQPPGEMAYHVLPYSLPGHHDCDTIRIIYNIHGGIQGPEHPSPGKSYSARGFPRHCYLPDNEIGRKILRLLVKAWERRLIFTIGPSSTTGEQNTVTWNEIHHKTEFGFNRHGHGYPDPNYFENVISELNEHGVVEQTYAWYPA